MIGRPSLAIEWPSLVSKHPFLVTGWRSLVIDRPSLVIGRPALVGGWPSLVIDRPLRRDWVALPRD